ncbi:hypothetical protein B5F53_12070 [Blautia sp. An249]|uniref:hypothetical protein n=1 Tax=Blautia sp. An249 TaxID=1965603 RepID=UPI000B399741|nr:hypothetical protein [Blautia sp. An249]OUO77940.1 hypothetical protein B5F53_12070 [Blautia sp. An249]
MDMEIIKNTLFDIIAVIGLAAISLMIFWWRLEMLNRIFKFSKIVIMGLEYMRNKKLYDLSDKLIVSKTGEIVGSCVIDLDEQIAILKKAIQNRESVKSLREKYSNK